MTISSSLNAGIAALVVNGTKLGAIADNIANASTNGYKRVDVDFKTLVAPAAGGSVYSAGSVRAIATRAITRPGPIEGSTNATDIAVIGRGFLPVSTVDEVTGAGEFGSVRLMTSGSFAPDKDGILRTATGQVLLGWPALPDGSMPSFRREVVDDLVPVRVDMNQFVANPTTEVDLGVNLPATATIAGAPGDPLDMTVTYYGNVGTAEVLTMTFTPDVPATGASNTWTLEISDSASGGATIASYTVVFNATQQNGGTLASVTPIGASPAYDPVTGQVPLAVGGGAISLDLGPVGSSSGLVQLSDSFVPVSVRRNGSPVGNMVGVEIDNSGMLYSVSSEGFARLIYQVPLIDVPNANALVPNSDQTYQFSFAAGNFQLWDAGTGPTGSIAGFSRELSTAELGLELTDLIRTQRAYSSGVKVVQTADELLQETNNLKR
jgi:flagellar hook protein FlgE